MCPSSTTPRIREITVYYTQGCCESIGLGFRKRASSLSYTFLRGRASYASYVSYMISVWLPHQVMVAIETVKFRQEEKAKAKINFVDITVAVCSQIHASYTTASAGHEKQLTRCGDCVSNAHSTQTRDLCSISCTGGFHSRTYCTSMSSAHENPVQGLNVER